MSGVKSGTRGSKKGGGASTNSRSEVRSSANSANRKSRERVSPHKPRTPVFDLSLPTILHNYSSAENTKSSSIATDKSCPPLLDGLKFIHCHLVVLHYNYIITTLLHPVLFFSNTVESIKSSCALSLSLIPKKIMSRSNPGSSSSNANDRRRRRKPPAVATSAATRVAQTAVAMGATALVVYGAYHLSAWCWNRDWMGLRRTEDEEEESDDPKNANDDKNGTQNGFSETDDNDTTPTTPHFFNTAESHQQQQPPPLSFRGARDDPRRLPFHHHEPAVAAALAAVAPLLRRRIEERTHVSVERQQLKDLRRKRRQQPTQPPQSNGTNGDTLQLQQQQQECEELWMTIQVETLTRWFTTVYTHTLLMVAFTIHWNVVAGRRNSQQQQQTGDPSEEDHLEQEALTRLLYDAFWTEGLDRLLSAVRLTVGTAVHDWRLTSAALPSSATNTPAGVLTWSIFHDAMQNVRNRVEPVDQQRHESSFLANAASSSNNSNRNDKDISGNSYCPLLSLSHLFIPSHETSGNDVGDCDNRENQTGITKDTDHARTEVRNVCVDRVLDETYDLLESPVARDALAACLETVFRDMMDQHWGPLFFGNNTHNTSAPTSAFVPLARVIAHAKPVTNSWYQEEDTGSGRNRYVVLQQRLASVQEAAKVSWGGCTP